MSELTSLQNVRYIPPIITGAQESNHTEAPSWSLPYELSNVIRYERPNRRKLRDAVSKKFSFGCLQTLYRFIPILYWLPRYKFKRSITGDLMAGITVAIMNVPQGMAYGMLGNLPPIVGIYMAFFPVLVYAIFGTSRHNQMGTFGIVCLMTGKVVVQYGNEDHAGSPYSNLEVAITITFMVAMIQFVMCLFRLGVVVNILSESLVKSLTCACACYVVASQLKDLMGLPIQKRRGYFSLPLTLYDSAVAVPQSNHYALFISIVVCSLLLFNNQIIKPRLAKKTKIPVPIELMAVSLGTLVSYLWNFEGNLQINTIGTIPTGLPAVKLPVFQLMPSIIMETAVIAIISYVISMSMALMIAQKDHYEVDSNQELFAMGSANLTGSIFSCMPISASLSRSVIAHEVGGSSQITSFISSGLLLLVLLWIGPVFSSLPRCILASIIVVAIKSLVQQIELLPRFWRQSKWDGCVFIVTFLTTTIISIEIGLCSGFFVSLLNLFYRGQQPYTCLLGWVPNTELYLDMQRFKGAEEIPNLRIIHYCGSLNFATKANFKQIVKKMVRPRMDTEEPLMPMKSVIFDFSALTYIDPSGVGQLRTLRDDFNGQNVHVILAGLSGPVYETIKRCDREARDSERFQVFLRLHDAVVYAKENYLVEEPKSNVIS